MKNFPSTLTVVALAIAGAFATISTASAQVAGGTTTTDVSVTERTQLAMGWSVKKTLMGKTVYNDAGQKVGKVEDLIISPERNVSYVIVGAGGFIGIGRHDVAIAVSQLQEKSGRLVMANATQDTIKGLPAFTYSSDSAQRDRFIAEADADIAKARTAATNLEKKASSAATDVKARMDSDLATLQSDLKLAEGRLSEMKHATAVRWKEFQSDVNAATARLRKSIEKATG